MTLKRTSLKRSTGLRQTSSLSQGGKTGLARAGRIPPVSARRRAENKIRRDALMIVRHRSGGRCEACPILYPAGILRPHSGRPHAGLDGHEIITRARRGSITDPDNILLVCRQSHDWITANSGKDGPAERLGLVAPNRSSPRPRR